MFVNIDSRTESDTINIHAGIFIMCVPAKDYMVGFNGSQVIKIKLKPLHVCNVNYMRDVRQHNVVYYNIYNYTLIFMFRPNCPS
jgi:hypothetical protein